LRLEALEERVTPTTYDVTPGGTGLNSLAGAIAQVNQDQQADTIVLAPGTYSLVFVGQQTVSTPFGLTIEGTASSASDTVIDAGGTVRAFLLEPSLSGSATANFTFQDLTIQNGFATDDGQGGNTAEGGGILAINSVNSVTLNDVVLKNNKAQGGSSRDAAGGGIYASGGTVTIKSSVIQGNTAQGGNGSNGMPLSQGDDGGGGRGGGFFSTSSTVTLLNH
jgi:hypothetical protein